MGGQRCIIHGSIHFPEVEFSGRVGTEAAACIRKALEKAKEKDFRPAESYALLRGRLEMEGAGCRVEPAYLPSNVLLGAGMLFTRTTTASLVWMVLNSIVLVSDKGCHITNSEPGYFSVVARNSGNGMCYTLGKSSLRAALRSDAGRPDHHRMFRDLAGSMGARVGIKEIVLGMPCREVLAVGEKFGYAISGRVPLGELIILNEWGFAKEVCRLEAQAERMRAGEGDIPRLEAEMRRLLGRLRDLEGRAEE